MSADTVEITDANFESEVLKSETPVLVDFWATWCPPCRAIAPSVDALATEYKSRAKVGKLNVDEAQGVAQTYQVNAIPTLLFFKGGQVVGQIVGAVTKGRLETELRKHV